VTNPKTVDALSELTSGEKSLLQLYLKVRKLPTKRSHFVIVLLAFAVTLAGTLWSEAPTSSIADHARKLATDIFQFAATILGIVVAGFAIFTTVATSHLVTPLVRYTRPELGVSELKYVTLHFIAAFVPFIAYIATHFIGMSVAWPGGPASRVVALLNPEGARVLASGMLASLVACAAMLIIVLQSFVFNVYKAFMTMARVNAELANSTEPPRTHDFRIDCGQGIIVSVPADVDPNELKALVATLQRATTPDVVPP
jgi:hypothetical protein